MPLAISDDDQSRKTEPTTSLDDARTAANLHDLLGPLGTTLATTTATTTTATRTTTAAAPPASARTATTTRSTTGTAACSTS